MAVVVMVVVVVALVTVEGSEKVLALTKVARYTHSICLSSKAAGDVFFWAVRGCVASDGRDDGGYGWWWLLQRWLREW